MCQGNSLLLGGMAKLPDEQSDPKSDEGYQQQDLILTDSIHTN
jgi:hypothetical protein